MFGVIKPAWLLIEYLLIALTWLSVDQSREREQPCPYRQKSSWYCDYPLFKRASTTI